MFLSRGLAHEWCANPGIEDLVAASRVAHADRGKAIHVQDAKNFGPDDGSHAAANYQASAGGQRSANGWQSGRQPIGRWQLWNDRQAGASGLRTFMGAEMGHARRARSQQGAHHPGAVTTEHESVIVIFDRANPIQRAGDGFRRRRNGDGMGV